jgi:hypothetical protein
MPKSEAIYIDLSQNGHLISGLLTSFGKNSQESLISKESTKIVEQLRVNSRCNSIYKKMASTPVDIATKIYRLIPTTLVLAIEPKKI